MATTKVGTGAKKTPVPQGQTALAVVDKNLGKMEVLALQLSKSGVVPMAYIGKPDNIFATIQFGRELGIPPMVALNNIASINGRPSMGTDLMLAIASRHPEWAGYEINVSTDQECKVTVYRLNKLTNKTFKFTGEFSAEDAQSAGLLRPNSPWDKYRKRMLKHRALAFALRDAFADALAGSYTYEEMEPEKFAQTTDAEFRVLDEIELASIENRGANIPEDAIPKPKKKIVKQS
jgi:hypothetical protein